MAEQSSFQPVSGVLQDVSQAASISRSQTALSEVSVLNIVQLYIRPMGTDTANVSSLDCSDGFPCERKVYGQNKKTRISGPFLFIWKLPVTAIEFCLSAARFWSCKPVLDSDA